MLLYAAGELAPYTRHTFTISYFKLGQTELRILLAIANLAVLVTPSGTLIGYQVPFFDIAGIVGAIGLGTVLLVSVVRNTSALYGEERLPD